VKAVGLTDDFRFARTDLDSTLTLGGTDTLRAAVGFFGAILGVWSNCKEGRAQGLG
jgi:hypothetical protein